MAASLLTASEQALATLRDAVALSPADETAITWVETRQDVAPIVAAARIVADAAPGREFRHAAFVPEAVLNRAFLEGWFHDPAAWKKWANDPANRDYRSWGGRL